MDTKEKVLRNLSYGLYQDVYKRQIIALALDDTKGHRHHDWTNEGRNTADWNFEDDEDFIQDTPNSNQHAGRQAFCTTDQVSTGFLQTVSLQCAGQNHQDDRDQLISVCNKGSSDRFQQVDDVDSAKNCCNDSRDDDDGNRFQLNGKTYNNHQYAKQTPIHKNTPSKKFRERTFCHKVGNLYDLC